MRYLSPPITLCLLALALAAACTSAPVSPTETSTPPPALTATRAAPSATPVLPTTSPVPPTVNPASTGEVDVGGRQLYYRCLGQGSPTVIVEAGLDEPGATGGTWEKVIESVQTATRICVYDRANLGKSDDALKPRTSQDIVKDLHALLTNAHIGGPYVLVGHSMGGLHMRLYAGQYPNDVSGVVLVDSSYPDQFERWLKSLPPDSPDEPAELKGLRAYFAGTADPTQNREGLDMVVSSAQVRAVTSFGDVPLVVLTRNPTTNPSRLSPGLNALVEQVWLDMQKELVALSFNSTHLVASRAGHNIQRDEPEAVVDAIMRLVK